MITDAEVERFIEDLGYPVHVLLKEHFEESDLHTDVRSALERFEVRRAG